MEQTGIQNFSRNNPSTNERRTNSLTITSIIPTHMSHATELKFALLIISDYELVLGFGTNSTAQNSGGNFKDRHSVGNWLLSMTDRKVNKPMDRQVLGDTAL